MQPNPTIQQLFDLSGRVVLLTGGCGHLGTAMSHALAEAGASLVITSRDAKKAQEGAEKLPRIGSAKHHGIGFDHMDTDAMEAKFAEVLKLAGKVDILVNNGTQNPGKDLTNVTAKEFTKDL